MKLIDKKMVLQIVGIMKAIVLGLSSCDDDDSMTLENLSTESIMDLVDGTSDLSTLIAVIDAAMLRETLNSDGPFTVFALTNAAFEEISDVTSGLSNAQISEVLKYHVVGAQVYSTDLEDGLSPATFNKETLTINVGASVTVTDKDGSNTDATVIDVNVNGTNGVIHVIDKVLIPTL